MDDLIIAGNCLNSIQHLKQVLDDTFRIKDLGCLKYFLGVEACRTSEGLNICQRKYALDILKEAGFTECKPVATPIVLGQKLTHADGEPLSDVGMYRRLVGRLLYLTATRPDLAYAVQQLNQFIDAPINNHLVAAHRVLKYIKKDLEKGIQYPAQSNLQLQAFTDVDWAACSATRRSITGFCMFLGGAVISWKSKK